MGLTGTIYDYAVTNGQTGGCYGGTCSADSTDSYASSFLSLVWGMEHRRFEAEEPPFVESSDP